MRKPVFASPRDVSGIEQCSFYHTMDIPGVGTVQGFYDLRGSFDEYLGPVGFGGKRVLEIGPGSGFLTFQMESRGADVVAIELSEEIAWDGVPYDRALYELWMAEHKPFMERQRNGFWFAHRQFGSKARVHYGTAYALPSELGRFDIAVMAAVLLHNRDPLGIIANCARVTDRTLVIVEQYDERLDRTGMAGMTLCPTRENLMGHTWWHISPKLLRQFVAILGFEEVHYATHTEAFSPVPGGPSQPQAHFTLVVERVRDGR